jgi:hypothetical protein
MKRPQEEESYSDSFEEI